MMRRIVVLCVFILSTSTLFAATGTSKTLKDPDTGVIYENAYQVLTGVFLDFENTQIRHLFKVYESEDSYKKGMRPISFMNGNAIQITSDLKQFSDAFTIDMAEFFRQASIEYVEDKDILFDGIVYSDWYGFLDFRENVNIFEKGAR